MMMEEAQGPRSASGAARSEEAAMDLPEELRTAGEEHLAGVCSTLTANVLKEIHEVHEHVIRDHRLVPPRVVLLLVGQHPAAVSYALSTVAAARVAGAILSVRQLDEQITAAALTKIISRLNVDANCHGGKSTH